MAVNDDLIIRYFRLATGVTQKQIAEYQQRLEANENPRDIKLELAEVLTRRYYGEEEANKAREEFIRVHSEQEHPEEVPELTLADEAWQRPLFQIVAEAFDISKTEARRVVKDGGVNVDEKPVTDPHAPLPEEGPVLVQKGKRHFVLLRRES
jgi:tyrosyl-tRNA synthetase